MHLTHILSIERKTVIKKHILVLTYLIELITFKIVFTYEFY